MAVERRTLVLAGALVVALVVLLVVRSTSDTTSAAANRPAPATRPAANANNRSFIRNARFSTYHAARGMNMPMPVTSATPNAPQVQKSSSRMYRASG